MNEIIVKRIKQARLERSLTQQDLAECLDRTASAISDLERGKVQISASDLYKLSKYLNKPIEYFYGDYFIDDDIQDLISIIRRMDPDIRENVIPVIKIIIQAQQKSDEIDFNDGDEIALKSHALEIYKLLIPYLVSLNELLRKGFKSKAQLEEVLGISEKDIPHN